MKKRMNKKTIFKTILFLSVLVSLTIGFIVFIPIEIQGSSMLPTLYPKDRVLVNTRSDIERFDVIVFRDQQNQPLVKRVIGLPGETVRYEDDQLYINQEPVNEPFLEDASLQDVKGNWTSNFSSLEVLEEEEIPMGTYFVLGDNRRFSYDSRFYGPVSEEAIIGEVAMVFYPFDRIMLAE